jgi:dual oxidase
VLGTDVDKIPSHKFAEIVKTWQVRPMKQDKEVEDEASQYMKSLAPGRRLRAYWEVHGPEWGFIVLVVSLQLAFGIWQMVKYITDMRYRHAFGWGVVLAKTSAGALYPTLFFLVISMSR